MTIHNIQLRLQLSGQQATQQMQRLNLQQSQAQQQQKQNLNQILQTQNRLNASVQQGGRYGQQQMRTGQSMVQTNRLLAQILQQQQRSSSLISQQLQQQQRSYQMQLNTLRSQVREAERLRQQLQQAGQAQRDNQRNGIGGGSNLMGNTAAVVGGAYAASSIGANYLNDPRQYMKQISLATDTVLAGQKISATAFNNKVSEMEGFVRKAAVAGGSKPQDLAQGLNTLVASNVYGFSELEDVMLQTSKTAFAAGAAPDDVAAMAVAQKNFGLTNLARANDQAMKAGQLGSFELRDMARYMPDLLTQGKGAGYIGDKGYQDLLVMMQLSKKTAGTAEGAAVNLSDLLGSFSQYHLGLSFAKHIRVQKGDPIAAYGVSKKRKGFDWTTYATNMREQGVGEVEAAALLMNRQMETSPLYRKYRDKSQEALKSGNNAEYLQNVQAATQIAAQSEIGKIFHNKQALMSFMGFTMNMGSGGFKEKLDMGVGDSAGTVDESHKRQASQEYAKDGSFETARFNAKTDNYNGVAGWLGDLKQELADFASSNEGVAAAASAAVLGLTAVAAAGGVAALAMRRGQPPIPPVPPSTGGTGAVRGALKTAGAAAAAYVGYELFQPLDDKIYKEMAQLFGLSGEKPDFVQQAIEKSIEQQSQQNSELLTQQQQANQLSQDISTKLSTLISTTAQNKPIPINMDGLLGGISNHAAAEEKRQGAFIPWKIAPK